MYNIMQLGKIGYTKQSWMSVYDFWANEKIDEAFCNACLCGFVKGRNLCLLMTALFDM